jgi:MFS family permease
VRTKFLSKTILVLSLVSLFTDVGSEMLYPVMPVYLKSIGFTVVAIGLLEGIAEAIAGLSKGYFGKWSDVSGKRLPFVQLGYLMSGLSRPIIGLLTQTFWIFTARTMDRFGKGLRTGARDAMLSDESSPENKGKVFGFHRSLDTLGAVLGPLFALWYLHTYPGQYRNLFLIAFIPGILAFSSTFLLKEKKAKSTHPDKKVKFSDFFSYWSKSPLQYKKLLIGLLTFALFNSSDVFLLLKAKEAGFSDEGVIGLFIFYNVIYSLLSYPMGALADKFGMKKLQVAGLILFACVYIGVTQVSNPNAYWFLFFIYGFYSACTEGNSKAWISNISDSKDTASALGTFAGFQSICLLLSSTICGLIWHNFGSLYTLLLSGAVALMCAIYLFLFVPLKK